MINWLIHYEYLVLIIIIRYDDDNADDGNILFDYINDGHYEYINRSVIYDNNDD